ncbi:hypothetical protein [Ancylobacter vacuolatus]|uniref:Uncharacterized protein n=1 Tax=Ancylobacter vacuolatus TaxID=223389 RepID=A0ABU0DPA6_9HYPH|nr:hypothetical protein [Ancylobacter vacuolatus]MDQ0350141.1 hypothetical protein [Ancylobacter vacuolatus]
MTCPQTNTIEAHLRDLLAGTASARPAQFSIGLNCGGLKFYQRLPM